MSFKLFSLLCNIIENTPTIVNIVKVEHHIDNETTEAKEGQERQNNVVVHSLGLADAIQESHDERGDCKTGVLHCCT